MNVALIVMTILGCDDTGVECHYIATVDNRWPTIELCDAVAESQLRAHANRPYPVIIAVCQAPEPEEATVAAQAGPSPPAKTVTTDEKRSLAGRALDRVRKVLPTTEGIRTVMSRPVRLVEDSYSWVARKFSP